jgi:2-polyprenyl-3-methyl-5-hydroxy-6-metoxy-1,4-benzoquinol methylase
MPKRKSTTSKPSEVAKPAATRDKKSKNVKELEKSNTAYDEEDANYSSKDYWNERYCLPCDDNTALLKNDLLSHEWYYTFEDLAPLIMQQDIIKHRKNEMSQMKVLEIGCGNKPLITSFNELTEESKPLFQSKNLYGIDFSEKVIEFLQDCQKDTEASVDSVSASNVKKQKKTTSQSSSEKKETIDKKIHFECLDARNLSTSYDNNSFDIIIDKGTMDAMLSEKKKNKGIENAQKMISEMIRCISTKNGLIMIISHIHPESTAFSVFFEDILSPALMDIKQGVVWKLYCHATSRNDESDDEGEEVKDEESAEKAPEGFGTVYCLTCCERRTTRNKESLANEVFLEFFEYDPNDEETDADEDGQSEN